jgi:acetylornithine deacetylase/succinyl-diaminopimelate desuccinylase-like protein
MKLPGRQLIARALFAVAVVATTATVGVTGFAQAAQPPQNGYGGGIDQLIAAINQFRQEVQTATNQYRTDVNACLGTSLVTPMSTQSGVAAKSAVAASDHKPATDKFNQHLDQTVGNLNARVGDGRSAQEGSGSFEKKYDDAAGQVFADIDGADNELATDMGVAQPQAQASRSQSGSLFNCLDQARDKYRHALDQAKAELLEAIRRILG